MHTRRSREYPRRIQGSSDKTLPLPPQPTLRIYLGFNLFLKTGQQKNLAPISHSNQIVIALVFSSCPERLFLLSTYASVFIHTAGDRNSSRFLMLRRLWHGSGDGATLVRGPKSAARPAKVDN